MNKLSDEINRTLLKVSVHLGFLFDMIDDLTFTYSTSEYLQVSLKFKKIL